MKKKTYWVFDKKDFADVNKTGTDHFLDLAEALNIPNPGKVERIHVIVKVDTTDMEPIEYEDEIPED